MLVDGKELSKNKRHQFIPNHKKTNNSREELINNLKESSKKEEDNKSEQFDDKEKLNNELEKYKKLYKSTKKELSEKDEKLQNEFHKKQNYLKNEILDLQKEISSLTKSRNETLKIITDKENEILKLNKKLETISEYRYELKAEKDKVYLLQEVIDSKLNSIEKESCKIERVLQDINDVKSVMGNLTIQKYKNQVRILKDEKIDLLEKNKKLFYEVEFLKTENELLKNENKVSCKNRINYLINSIDDTNWSEYKDSMTLYNLYLHYQKESIINNKDSLSCLFGHLNEEKNVFVSIDGDEYLVSDILFEGEYLDSMPSKAIPLEDDNNKVIITQIYNNEESYKTEMQLVIDFNRNNKKEKESKSYERLGDERITFITYINGNKIKDSIAKYGFDTEWINPSESSLEVTRNKIFNSDLTVIYPNYCSHEIVYNFDNNDHNILYAYSFNEILLMKEIMKVIKNDDTYI
ncbi:hypothetical protein [Lysinibacillus sp. BPa_S21]|uniref:hypothetical protein n=1 Tax=Lysinibacillus sp. BPa_S21 TaxID=2932478 RepID=UPI002010D144|nr:hypothetical protein [Lysinibacillus sp. BPa_S21]MCL1696358.1 hypothetical protein [Lysinibacillus sp. BPa_S21]